MLWILTIPFALGILFSPHVGGSIGWQMGLLALGVLLMSVLYRRRVNVLPVLVVNSLLLGLVYGQVRGGTDVVGHSDLSHRLGMASGNKRASSPQAGAGTISIDGLSEPHQALLSAMLLGNRSALSKEQKNVYRQAGAQHLLALSGMHLGIFLTLLSVLVLRYVRFSRWRWPVLMAVLALLWFYALMVGMPKSLLRAILMATLFLLGRFLLRPTKGHEVLACSVLFMLLADPLCAFDVGAQLSVAALVGIVCFFPGSDDEWRMQEQCSPDRGDRPSFWFSYLRVSVSAWLFTMPLVVYHFHQFQPWQPVVSIVLVPLTSLMLYAAVFVLSVTLLDIHFLTAPLTFCLDKLMDVQEGAIRLSASLPLSCIEVSHITLWHVALIYLLLFVVWVIMRSPSFKVLMYAFLLIVLLFVLFLLL